MIRNIVFDMGGVLIDFDGRRFIDRLGVPQEDREELFREVFESVEWTQLDRGIIPEDQAVESICARLPERDHGYVASLIHEWWVGPIVPIAGMAELIAELKGLGYGVYLLSNAEECHPKYWHRVPGSEYFDGLVVSAQWHQLKPEREIYQTLFRECRLTPAECLFIDDLRINIEAALFAGMSGVVFRGDMGRLRRELCQAGVPVKC